MYWSLIDGPLFPILLQTWFSSLCVPCLHIQVRDAFFQRDPFAAVQQPHPLMVFEEHLDVSTEHWLVVLYRNVMFIVRRVHSSTAPHGRVMWRYSVVQSKSICDGFSETVSFQQPITLQSGLTHTHRYLF